MPKHPALTLFLLVVLFHVAGTWSLPLIDRDEPRFAEASREMIQRGDFVVPFLNNQPRYDKPPLVYWCQAACFAVFGENEFAARFPSVLAAAATSLVIFWWGRRMGGAQVGWWAAWVFAFSLQMLVHGKAAVADGLMVLFYTLASWAGWELLRTDRRSAGFRDAFWWLFYMAFGIGFLAKGPVALLPLGAVWICAARQQRSLQAFRFAHGLLLTLAIVASWGVPALLRTHGDFFRVGIGTHVIQRSVMAMEGHGGRTALWYLLSLPFYFVTVFASFFPWSLWLPKIIRGFRRWDAADAYLACGALLVFAVFTPLKTKLPHYTLPALPLLALLFTRWWFREKRSSSPLGWCAAGMIALNLALALGVFPIAARRFPAKSLFLQSRAELSTEMEIGTVDFHEPSVGWCFRRVIRGWQRTLAKKDADTFLRRPGARLLLLPTAQVESALGELDPDWKSVQSTGVNVANGRPVDLTLVIKSR